MSYLALKHLHITCALLTIVSFSLRGYWMLVDSQLLQHKLVRILPHMVDTVLLASAVALTITIQQYPFQDAWLTAKLFALLVYIAFGTMALKRGRTKRTRAVYFVLSIATFVYIFSVARSHQAIPWFDV